ncbi:hypothetical protein EBZ39_04170 [bacterium]|nr:hypothetical protein [bacterium]
MWIDDKHRVNVNDLENTCKTGDLVLFRWYYMDAGFRLFSNFSHVGLIVRKPSGVYILEMHPEGEYLDYPSGVHLHPLRDRVESYAGPCYFLRYLGDHESILNVTNFRFNEISNLEFDTNFRNNFVLNYFLCTVCGIKLPKPKKMFCSQFIGYVLHLAGAIDDYTNLSPSNFTNLKSKNGELLYGHKLRLVN